MPQFDGDFVNPLKRIFLLLLVTFAPGGLVAQPGPVRGIVWEMPETEARAVQDLLWMRQVGIEAVRTGVVANERLLSMADTLGLQLYQELPVSYVSAARLLDSLDAAARLLGSVLERARAHPSARHFGLSYNVDTSNPAACAYFEQLAALVREAAIPESRVYYVTTFMEADRCASSVDFVLLDVLDHEQPVRALQRWQARPDEVPAGIGALGTWVRDDTLRGLHVPHAPEVQARYLENALRSLLIDSPDVAPVAVFVHRWRDVTASHPSPAYELDDPYRRPYGLLTADGQPRPAMAVVRGIYTGRQQVFAFRTGEAPARRAPLIMLLGWSVVGLLAVYYALSPRFRHMVPRYFRAHNFYQDAVREGRDVLFAASMVLLVGFISACGITLYVVLQHLRTQEAFVVFFQHLPQWLQDLSITLLQQPWGLVFLSGLAYALVLMLWAGLLAIFSRRRYMLVGGQAMMLVLWPRWPLLLVMVAAMLVPSLPPEHAEQAAVVLVVSWVTITFYAVLRTLYDYTVVTRVPLYVPFVLFLVNPLIILALGAALVLWQAPDFVTFLWNLARYH